MRIQIEYDSCWQTSFLDGEHNSVKSRKFIATSVTHGEKPAPITKNTIMGILCRLIGDQRKLAQSKDSESYYFSEIEDDISFSILPTEQTVKDLMYLTNKSEGRCGQSTFMGVLPDDNPWFFSGSAPLLWSVLILNKRDLVDFILGKAACENRVDCSPKNLIARLDLLTDSKSDVGAVLKSKERLIADKNIEIQKKENNLKSFIEKNSDKDFKSNKQKENYNAALAKHNDDIETLKRDLKNINANSAAMEFDGKINKVVDVLSEDFPGCEYWSDGVIYPIRLYAAALYLQAKRLLDDGVNIDFVKNTNDEIQIQGFSKRGFNGIRDWLNPMAGGRKKMVGTPCIVDKQSGVIEITIDVDKDKAIEIEALIENAGVSAFYLGKKGLAYVSKIRF
jgi:hypothetical protein